MALRGYLLNRNETVTSILKKWMSDHGAEEVLVDRLVDESSRPLWHQTAERLSAGDVLFIESFGSTFRGFVELMAFSSYCTSKGICLVSVDDEYDSRGIIFPKQDAARLFDRLSVFLKSSSEIRHSAMYSPAEIGEPIVIGNSMSRSAIYGQIINMYKAGSSMRDILLSTGYTSTASIYRVLKLFDVPLRSSHPSSKNRNKKETKTALVLRLFESGKSIDYISKSVCVTVAYCRTILKRHGIIISNSNEGLKKRSKVIELFSNGYSRLDIAKITGYSVGHVYRLLTGITNKSENSESNSL